MLFNFWFKDFQFFSHNGINPPSPWIKYGMAPLSHTISGQDLQSQYFLVWLCVWQHLLVWMCMFLSTFQTWRWSPPLMTSKAGILAAWWKGNDWCAASLPVSIVFLISMAGPRSVTPVSLFVWFLLCWNTSNRSGLLWLRFQWYCHSWCVLPFLTAAS